MDCESVCIGGDFDWDGSSTVVTTWPKARRAHKCCECRRVIVAGEVYQRDAVIFDGRVATEKTCGNCAEIRSAFCCSGWEYGSLWAVIREELFPMMTTNCLNKLTTTEAKQFLRDRWQDWNGLAEKGQ